MCNSEHWHPQKLNSSKIENWPSLMVSADRYLSPMFGYFEETMKGDVYKGANAICNTCLCNSSFTLGDYDRTMPGFRIPMTDNLNLIRLVFLPHIKFERMGVWDVIDRKTATCTNKWLNQVWRNCGTRVKCGPR